MTEVRIGLVILAGLGLLAGWVFWRGGNPDPELFSMSQALLDKGSDFQPSDGTRGVSEQSGQADPAGQAGGASTRAAADRGPVPTELAAAGWTERSIHQFDGSNLYEKIDGREGFYKSFGFQRLYFISLEQSSAAEGAGNEDETLSVDIEMYDLGSVSNALGAYAGERQPDARAEMAGSAIGHLAQNALFLVQGKYYIRAIGSDESAPIKTELAHLRERFGQGLTGEALPWAYTLFVGQLGLDPGKVGYAPENAFSFDFASHVYTAEVDEEGTELFTVLTADPAAAASLAKQFTDGFLSIGKSAGKQDGVAWVEDQYLGTIAGTTVAGQLVVGIRSASAIVLAREKLAKLKESAAKLPRPMLDAALTAQENAAPIDGGYGDDPAESPAGQSEGEPGSAGPATDPTSEEEVK